MPGHLEEEGFFLISSLQINAYRKARLMAKFDTKELLPKHQQRVLKAPAKRKFSLFLLILLVLASVDLVWLIL